MTTKDLRGQETAKAMGAALAPRINALKSRRIIPTLAIVRVGEKPDDVYYQRSATRRCEALGISVEVYAFSEGIAEEQLVNEIMNLNMDEHIHGILILRPLPGHIDDAVVCKALNPGKDVDGVTDRSLAGVMKNERRGFSPCTARACIEILDYFGIEIAGRHTVVIGRSLVVGKPLSLMLTARDATVTVCHTKTRDLTAIAKQADILVAAAGRSRMINREYVKEDAVVIDVGINADENGNLTGDVDYEDVRGIASAITPVPGGVGIVTTAVLASQVVEAAEQS
ncbi:MAG: bifunctional 5,10-methylene-tetrahydrofolate dehydrogenase/5,10-methylene-tetrahydrofolate cyclohydrolase [Oscillospiraceae bacterium]|nr:bifunctional 5,10-methylene-tetrahydrofolate dehydrogenase/5,10-methylene-tetrahydrofolate cyclohydrolase [Oscillospiraceae bacterium]